MTLAAKRPASVTACATAERPKRREAAMAVPARRHPGAGPAIPAQPSRLCFSGSEIWAAPGDPLPRTKTDGARVDLWFRSTVGLRRTASGWQITHEHESTPFYMDGSGRAATDLRL